MNTLPPMVPLLLYLMLQTDPQLSPNACGSTRSLSTKQYRRGTSEFRLLGVHSPATALSSTLVG